MRTAFLLFAAALLVGCASPPATGPDYGKFLDLAAVYRKSGEPERAFSVLLEATRSHPGRPEAWTLLGELAYDGKDLDRAAEYLKRSLAARGDDPMVLNNYAWVEMERGNNAAALTAIEGALELGPQPLFPYLDTLARVKRAAGCLQDALEAAEHALLLAPADDPEARNALEEMVRQLRKTLGGGRP